MPEMTFGEQLVAQIEKLNARLVQVEQIAKEALDQRDASRSEVRRLQIEYDAALASVRELGSEVGRLRDRLQIDPGGSDRIDELEQALQFAKGGRP